jgi:hypothetical protein
VVPGAEGLLEPLERLTELELPEHLAEARAVRLTAHQVLEVELDLDVLPRGGEPLGDARVLSVALEVLLALGPRDLVDVGQHPLEVAELLQELGRRLLADAGDAGEVVRGVALQTHEVGDELGGDPVAIDHRRAVVQLGVGDPPARGHHPDVPVDELEEVTVAGDHHHLDALPRRAVGDRGDDVVGLVALHPQVAVTEGLDQRLEVRPLLGQQVGPGPALGLVLFVLGLAPGHAGVPDHEGRLDAVLGDDLHEHRGEAEDRVGRLPA